MSSKRSPELEGQGYGWQQPPGRGHWPRIPLPSAGTAAAPAVGQAAEVCGRRWRAWQPALGLGSSPWKAGGLRGCGRVESAGCSFQNPQIRRHPCSGPPTSAARLGPCAPPAPPAPRGSGCGRAALGWGPPAESLGPPGPRGAVPAPAGPETGCEGPAAVSGRPGARGSAGGWATPSGSRWPSRRCGRPGGRSGPRRLRSRCPRSSGGSGGGGAADLGA